jgi:S1-C subfamily serine protease
MPVAFVLAILIAVPTPVSSLVPSCAWVRAENDAAGTGFIVDVEKKLLITCRHIVGDRAKVDVIFPWFHNGELVTDRKQYLANRVPLRERGLLVTGTVLRKSDELDLALVELPSLPPGVTAVTLSTRAAQPGESLRAIGNRLDLETAWNMTNGPLRAGGRLADGYYWRGKKLAVNADVLIGQLPIEEGDSGGPVFNPRGEVVGMVAALRRQSPLAAVAISAREVRSFAGFPEPPARAKPSAHTPAEMLQRATVWVRPTATDVHCAGVLIDNDVVLTIGKGLTPRDRVGIALPVWDGARSVADRAAYRDPLGLQLNGHWRSGTVIAHDADRDLALIRLDSPASNMQPLKLAAGGPAVGEAIHTMNHPGGLEFAWVYAAGAVRQRGRLAMGRGDRARRVAVLICQLPAQTGSPGGAVVNKAGELAGIVSAKESAQMVGYAVAVEEIGAFLDVARIDRTARTLPGLLARIEVLPECFLRGAALSLARRADQELNDSQFEAADRDARAAIALDAESGLARVCRVSLLLMNGRKELAGEELDVAVEKGPFNRDVLIARAELAVIDKEWRKARGDLERILDVNPADAEARQWLANVLLELGDNPKAAAAVADTLRADPKRLPVVAVNLLGQADRLAQKFPDAPSVPAGWLLTALTASKRTEFASVLKQAKAAKTDEEQLRILRAGIKKIAG